MKAEQQWIKKFKAYSSYKYVGRYDVDHVVYLRDINLIELPIPFGVVTEHFICSNNNLTSLYNAPIEVGGSFDCSRSKLTTLDHLPNYIGDDLVCQDNPFQNLNGLKDVEIKNDIVFSHRTEEQLNYWIKALFNTDLDALEYHYDNHRYNFWGNNLENYIKDVLEEIIKIKAMKNHLNL